VGKVKKLHERISAQYGVIQQIFMGGPFRPLHPPWELGLRVVQQYLSGGPVPDTMTGFQEPLCKISHHYLKKK